MSSRASAIPLDLIHSILSHLHLPKDAASLSACSAVCRSWLPIARKYLFADLTMSNARPRWRHHEWRDFYRPHHCELALVRRLFIRAVPSPVSIRLQDLLEMASCLPRLQRISLSSTQIERGDEQSIGHYNPNVHLDALELMQVACSGEMITDLLHLFQPRALALHTVVFTSESYVNIDPSPSQSPTSLNTPDNTLVSLRVTDSYNFYDLADKLFFTGIGHLCINISNVTLLPYLRRLLGCTQHLETLELVNERSNVVHAPELAYHAFRMNLAQPLKELHALRRCILRLPNDPLSHIAPSAPISLECIMFLPSSLEYLELHLGSDLFHINWRLWDAAVSRHFSLLRSFKVLVDADMLHQPLEVSFGGCCAVFRNLLPTLGARGVVQILMENW